HLLRERPLRVDDPDDRLREALPAHEAATTGLRPARLPGFAHGRESGTPVGFRRGLGDDRGGGTMRLAWGAVVVLLLAAGSSREDTRGPTALESPSPAPSTSATGPAEPAPVRVVRPDDLRPQVAVDTVRHLAGEIGPRHATSPAYRRAAAWV